MKGFSLIELLVAIAIVAILAMVATSAYRNSVEKTQIAAVRSGQMRNLVIAVNLYRADNNMAWPAPRKIAPDGNDNEYYSWYSDQDSKDIIKKLAEYFKNSDGVKEDGTFLDPWGNQFCMKWDVDGSGAIEYWSPTFQENIKEKFIVVSYGKNKQMDDPKEPTCDDVFSFCPYKDTSLFQ